MRREGEEGGLGTVLVLNSLLYANTPVKDMGDGYLSLRCRRRRTPGVLFGEAGGREEV